jgi:hypothetical protein
MTQSPMVIQDEETRKAVDPQVTIGDLCIGALEDMVAGRIDAQNFTILHKGGIYYFTVACTGYRPPYNMLDVSEGGKWFGQRPN